MEVIRLEPAHIKQVAAVCSHAMIDYPQIVCYFPSDAWRKKYFQGYSEVVVRFAQRYAETYTTSDLNGFISWSPPGKTLSTTWTFLRTPGVLRQVILVGLKNFSRILASEEYVAKLHEEIMPGPHWYLWGLAVQPECQGLGIGSALMKPVLARADQQGLPVYLETHNESNVAYYQKRGFEVARHDCVPKMELPFWCMVRQPRG